MDMFPGAPGQEPELPDSTPLDPDLPGIDGLDGIESIWGSGYAVTVHTPGSAAVGGAAALSIEIRSVAGINEPLTLCIDLGYLDAWGTISVSPAAEAESSDGMYKILDFPAPHAPEFRIDISGTVPGGDALPGTGDLNVYVGGIHVASIDLRTGRAM
ncbi:hypothetical protein [Arthrobacter sp. AQ5-05]|uniref:hypothetical protein n=1 Tax=Arthrobacter sp. AQ5-05 TaxID=2184581 RepID=UPI0011BF232B|nr:hypothetical protein [Arthrobacter sp. AQ5-05]